MAIDESRVRAEPGGCSQGHGRVDAKFAGCTRGCGDDPTLVCLSSHYHRFAFQRWIEQLFDGHEERMHVYMTD